MNLWYTFVVTGLVLALDSIAGLLSDRGSNPVTLTAKERRITAVVRTASGLFIIWFAWWVIRNGWYQSGVKVTFTSVWEGMAYALAVAGAFRLFTFTFTTVAFFAFGLKGKVRDEANKALLGVYLFAAGGIALSIIDKILVGVLLFIFVAVFTVIMHLFTRAVRSEPPPSTTTKA